jgi:hypothetical protein
MARTVLTSQRLQAIGGQEVTFQAFDSANGHQVKNVGIQVVLVKLATGETLTVTIPSVADPYNRVGDQSKVLAGPTVEAFGPYVVPTIWGDGAAQLFIDGTGASGSPVIAVIEVG